ncbi:MAG: MarR family winged helix-turn-helix transcriptional regulator [Halofilum sp. (in: g-proteobacteria)]|nr:MarR family winged helix-turn-helix transcriptional regulator [Halofilum sp. (in: g-proteobacteria)]
MSEPSTSHPPHVPAPGAREMRHGRPAAGAANDRDHALHDPADPVTDWLLEQPRIGADEFAVLFAIHQFNGRPRGSGWIRRVELGRSSGLDQVSLTSVLNDLRQKGLVGMSRHPVDSTRARYLLMTG